MKKIILIIVLVLAAGVGGFLYWRTAQTKDHTFNYDPGDKFSTDITDSYRILKTDIIISMSDDRKTEYYAENNHIIRNIIINILRGRTEADFRTAEIQNTIAEEILSGLRTEFGNEEFLRIYFNEFVIQ
ncbi:MAG: flagellar basal body-associated FliL family protein [Clostridia bacterium]|nr:flagellar basal body-associated FliL family protein [Clostridia bacterium]